MTWPLCIPLLTHINYVTRSLVWNPRTVHTEEAAKSAELLLKCFKTSKAHTDNPLIFKSEAAFHFHMVWCDDRDSLQFEIAQVFSWDTLTLPDTVSRAWKSMPKGPEAEFSITFPSSGFKIQQTPQTLMKESPHTSVWLLFPPCFYCSRLTEHRPIEYQLPLEAKIVLWRYSFFFFFFIFPQTFWTWSRIQ